MTDPEQVRPGDVDRAIIEEFRANAGKVGGMFEGAPLVLLTTVGARTGRSHTVPVVYRRDGDRILVFGSNAGADTHPAWYHNVRANPEVTVEIGTGDGIETCSASAEILAGVERDRHYAAQSAADPAFAAYQAATARIIPVVALRPSVRPGLGRRGFQLGTRATATIAAGVVGAGVVGALAGSGAMAATPPARQRAAAIGEHLRQVHAQLRRDLAAIRAGLDDHLAGPAAAAKPALPRDLRTHCVVFCGALHEHHTSEDGVFPALVRLHPELEPVVARLGREHAVVAAALTELRELLDAPEPGDATHLRAEFDRLAAELESHFDYEEQTLVDTLNAADPAALRRAGGQR